MKLYRILMLAVGLLCMSARASALILFNVNSTAVHANGRIGSTQVYNSFGCSGANQSPDLSWKDLPKATKFVAVTMFDPDAPTGSGFWHWVVFNLPATTTTLKANAGAADGSGLPEGAIQGRTDFGTYAYGGPCPPPGLDHRYIFKVYALKDKIPLDKDASPAMVGFHINQLKIAEGTLVGFYGRHK
jgi:hypothetical protein